MYLHAYVFKKLHGRVHYRMSDSVCMYVHIPCYWRQQQLVVWEDAVSAATLLARQISFAALLTAYDEQSLTSPDPIVPQLFSASL